MQPQPGLLNTYPTLSFLEYSNFLHMSPTLKNQPEARKLDGGVCRWQLPRPRPSGEGRSTERDRLRIPSTGLIRQQPFKTGS